MPDLLVITEMQCGTLSGRQARVLQGLDRSQHRGHCGLVIQMPGADEPAFSDDYTRIEGHEIAHLDP